MRWSTPMTRRCSNRYATRSTNDGSVTPPDVSPLEEREGVEHEPEEEDQEPAPYHLPHDRPVVGAAGAPGAERQLGGDADDEEEEREDQVGGRPPVPRGVLERRVDVRPRARVVDEQHPATVSPRNTSSESRRSRAGGAAVAGPDAGTGAVGPEVGPGVGAAEGASVADMGTAGGEYRAGGPPRNGG
jgi:hypothetical protein